MSNIEHKDVGVSSLNGTPSKKIYIKTSTEAVYNPEGVTQEYINNHVDGSKIVDGTITTSKIANNAVAMGKLGNEVQTLIQQGADSSWTPMGDYDVDALYYANDLVFDPETNSSYLSLRADNMGHPVTDEEWWMKVVDGSVAEEAAEVANEAAQTANAAAAQAMSVVANKVADAQIGYFECNTAANTSIKATTSDTIGTGTDASTFKVPATGASVKIKMKYANTADTGVKLQFGSNTATQKDLLYNGEAVSASNSWDAGEVISVYYDGTYYQASNAQGGSNKTYKSIQITESGKFVSCGQVGSSITISASPNTYYALYSVSEGDVVYISGYGFSAARSWAIVDANNVVIENSHVYGVYEQGIVKVMPANAAKIALNCTINYAHEWYWAKAGSVGANELIAKGYLCSGLSTFKLGYSYETNQSVYTTDGQLLRVTKKISPMSVTEVVGIGELKTYGSGTYQAQKAVNAYSGTAVNGSYYIGRPSGAVVGVSIDAEAIAAITEATDITIIIAGVECIVSVTSESTAASIAESILSAFGTQEEWSLVADGNDNTKMILTSKVAKTVTPTISSSVGDSGVTVGFVEDSAYAGSASLSLYSNDSWSDVALEDYAADNVAVGETDATKMWKTLDLYKLTSTSTEQNSVYKDLDSLGIFENVESVQYSETVGSYKLNERTHPISNPIGFVTGRKYKIVATLSVNAPGDVSIYLCNGGSSTDSVLTIGSIPSGSKTTEIVYIPDVATNAQYLNRYANSTTKATINYEVYELEKTRKIDKIGTPPTIVSSISEANYERRHQVGTSGYSATGNRYTFGLDVKAGDTFEVQSYYSPGIDVSLYNNFDNGCIANVSGTGKLHFYGGYTTSKVTGTCNCDGLLIIKFRNSSNTAITDAEMEAMKGSTTLKLKTLGTGVQGDVIKIQEQIARINEDISQSSIINQKLLYIGRLVQKSFNGNNNTFTDSSVMVTQKCALIVPYYNVKIKITLPFNYRVGIKAGYTNIDWSILWTKDSGWLENNDTFTFDGYNEQIYRVYFGKIDGSAIDIDTVQHLIDSGEIQLSYFSNDGNIITRNSHTEHYVKGLMRDFTDTLANNTSLHKMPVFTHTSDIHGDALRYKNFVEYSDFLEVGAALMSGDIVPMCGAQDYTDYIDDIADKYNVMVLPCIGNHDARSNITEQLQNVILSHSISKWSLQTPANSDYPTYYYKDIANQSIRIITLNLYCAGQKTTNDWRLTQEQITWFVDTLASTPAGYGVIIVMHSPETTTVKDSTYGKFFQTYDTGSITYNNPYFPIRKIVDAFISKTIFQGSFTETITGSVVKTITIDADFSSVDTSTEFICYMTGHRHKDCVGYVDGATNKQLMCNVALGMSLYGGSAYPYYAEEMDLPRDGKGVTQDSFNVYVVDRNAGNLRIARVGSNMNSNFEMRDYLTISYRD